MARQFGGGNLTHGVALVTAAPFTASVWSYFHAISATVDYTLCDIGKSGGDTHRWSLYIHNTDGQLRYHVATTSGVDVVTSNAVVNKWQHFCIVEASATSHSVFYEGANKVTGTTSKVPSGVNRTVLGARSNAGAGPLAGLLADWCLWNVALTDFEVALLARGVPPFMIQPNKIVEYLPLGLSDHEYGLIRKSLFVKTAPVSFANRPGQLWSPYSLSQRWGNTYVPSSTPWAKRRPRSRDILYAAAAGGSDVPAMMNYYRQRRA